MKNLESGKDKIQKICDVIRKETLEPIKQEAREIIENARLQASDILREAENKAATLIETADAEIKEKKRLFESSLSLSCRQGIEMLKQKIEQELFSKEIDALVAKETSNPQLIVRLIESFMRSLEEQGIEEDFEVFIPKEIPARSINALLGKNILERLKNKSVELGDFQGGVQIKMQGRQITIDISNEVVRELIAAYIRRDFRDLIFQV
ncbi:MAG TPA: HrpE/YscL family type III secretion apparatus protein [Chlamydiales bacterium]|jgi:V/A-type H+-transporting ATPase subunit E|nr:HrpE/YscL family type III secretion apparatus protein [Chlamydiales bacterium]